MCQVLYKDRLSAFGGWSHLFIVRIRIETTDAYRQCGGVYQVFAAPFRRPHYLGTSRSKQLSFKKRRAANLDLAGLPREAFQDQLWVELARLGLPAGRGQSEPSRPNIKG